VYYIEFSIRKDRDINTARQEVKVWPL